MEMIATLFEWLNRLAVWFLLPGIALLLLWHFRLWRRDSQRLASLRSLSKQPVHLQAAPKVSVLVAAWNEKQHIAQHIDSFLALRYPAKELVLCAGGQDDTYSTACQYASEQVIVLQQNPGEGKQRALKRCLEAASGEIAFLADADTLVSDDAFERVLAPVVNGSDAATTGTIRPLIDQTQNSIVAFQWASDSYASSFVGEWSPGLRGCNAAISMPVLRQVHAFEVEAKSGTDYTLARQLLLQDYKIRYVPSSTVQTEYPDTVKEYFYKRSRWLRNLITIGFTTGDRTQLRNGIISASVAAFMLFAPFVSLLVGAVLFVPWLLLLIHGLLTRFRYIALHDFEMPISKLRVAWTTTLMFWVDMMVWLSGFVQAVVPRWNAIWR